MSFPAFSMFVVPVRSVRSVRLLQSAARLPAKSARQRSKVRPPFSFDTNYSGFFLRKQLLFTHDSLAQFRSSRLLHGSVVAVADGATSVAAPETTYTKRPGSKELLDSILAKNPNNNVSEGVAKKIGINLHQRPSHPLGIIKRKIEGHFEEAYPGTFRFFDDFVPVVTVKQNFDELLVPEDHVSRNPNDTYYIDAERVLRCHTSAHQTDLLRQGFMAFLCTGDVYRRDSIDATHYPAFHQMEGVRIFTPEEVAASGLTAAELAEKDLKKTLEGLVKSIFGEVEMRWVDAYFPFTDPSFELEIFFQGQWMEVLGCGVVQQKILDSCELQDRKGWAFGLGLERLAMVLFDIPDIRLFWTDDTRFISQFKEGQITKFKSYSKFPPCLKDVSFWVSPEFTENNLCEIVRSTAGDLAEKVDLIDEFTNKKTGKTSKCYRITYRSMDRSLTDEEINQLQATVRERVAQELLVELR
eukprot:CAMPEP_0184338300 /NCGR_PEP_ID=MMETSP1089-20130417/6824_1 /TAXON_ID=38269 ORGANISM="Gloeochaete wittrockiana, Strain SAG46.84" /NCGR_SAMPLE_ID=MMETSP1089 /ASSEMBLY_ACC=CAM_ASM_000445 /LENGTH=468 /DNA_ID=CAMNT_0026664717 /DNA_START=40 /DNA_END=1446 /DNA_ORIENTATION=-